MSLKGTLYIVSAPSGAGKSSLINALLNISDRKQLQVSVSHTTRDPRPGEVNGEHYHFVDQAEFKGMIADKAFFEWAEVFGNFYGTSRLAIEDSLNQGIDVFLDIDWQGARQVKALMPEAKGIFILPPSREALEQRLYQRGQDSEETINKRMAQAKSEMSHYDEYDFLIINDDFDQALAEFDTIIKGQRLAQTRQSALHRNMISELLA
ncbi:guanylate kinase [Motilimonas sp. 1_MG-2023]|uniref:guanylate kinase n=1 Tax=Motilimonas TaxID=1914248 RepID=UPI0026E2230F|nr:guanylate kinase [Motilimonas sp. 1_MG-2023]MDO6526106.1 guanylate kinase [Motilimonas sp. 1_MG-2023]